MGSSRAVGAEELRTAVAATVPWLDGHADKPQRSELAAAVRLSLRTLEQLAPGGTVEVRVPPFAAVQCLAGPQHTRGTPPNVVECGPRTWLMLATGRMSWQQAHDGGEVSASGARADLSDWLPLLKL